MFPILILKFLVQCWFGCRKPISSSPWIFGFKFQLHAIWYTVALLPHLEPTNRRSGNRKFTPNNLKQIPAVLPTRDGPVWMLRAPLWRRAQRM